MGTTTSPSGSNRILIAAGGLSLVALVGISFVSKNGDASTTPVERAAAPQPNTHHAEPAALSPATASPHTPAANTTGATQAAAPSATTLDDAAIKTLMEQGEDLYHACIMCHGPTGEGIPGQFPPLKGAPYVVGPESRLARVLLHGMEGVVVVGGNTFNIAMPAAPLNDDDEVAAVMTFVRRSFGNNAGAVSPTTVARIREETRSREKSWTARELDEVP